MDFLSKKEMSLTDEQSQTLNSMNLFQAKEYYESLGFSVIPLIPGGKKPTCDLVFSKLQPDYAWAKSPPDANIGIRCGGKKHLVVLDCDEKYQPGTYKRVIKFLKSNGLYEKELLIVQTASQGGTGRHIYFQCPELEKPRGSVKLLPHELGAGEIRYGYMAYVAAPPSIITPTNDEFGIGGTDKVINGDFAVLPVISLEVLKQLHPYHRFRD